ncbi:MAG: ATP-binding protein [Cyclobacteriaceae bacterium]
MSKETKRHSFEPGAMSIIQMGEELIGHPTTAINELVKNGYDADATEVCVYVNINESNSFVLIFDNGLGMHKKTLFGDWLKPSVSAKRIKGAKSEIFERSFLGSKGIGRLASMALGRMITVVTKRNEEKEYNWLTIDSSIFKEENRLLKDVTFPGDSIKTYYDLFSKKSDLEERKANENEDLLELLRSKKIGTFKEGALVIIEDIDESVKALFKSEFEDNNEIEDSVTLRETAIYRGLSVLVTPLKLDAEIQKELFKEKIIDEKKKIAKGVNAFDVSFGSNFIPTEKRFEFTSVKPIPIMDRFDYRAIGKVTKDGNVFGRFTCQRLEKHVFSEEFILKNEEIFEKEFDRLKEKKKPKELTETEWNASAGEFYFDIRVYDRGEEDSKEKLFGLVEANTTEQKRKIIDSLLGLRISKNGFGVKPYGDEVKDWLDLSQIRVQGPGFNVSVNQILGYVFFYSPENDGLKEKTNREGFYANRAFSDTRNILQAIFKNIGQLRYNFRLKHNLGRIVKNKLQRPNIDKFINFIQKNGADEVKKRSEEFVREITTALDNMEDTLSFSQRLASLGTGLELIYHEMSQPIAKIGGSRAILHRKVGRIKEEDIRTVFIEEISHIGSFVAELDELKSSLKPAIGKSRHQLFKPNHIFKKVCYLFRKDISEENIELLIHPGSENFEIEDYEYALWISFLNIINNAVYWLRLNEENRKYISFSIEKKNQIVIINNGPFIPEDYIDLIFEYGITLKKEKSATGLGLAFTRNILNLNNWEITAENRKEGPAFIITKRK